MELKILFKNNYFNVIIEQNYDSITVKELIEIITKYSNDHKPLFKYVFQCICGEIISEEIQLKNLNCKRNHIKIPNTYNNIFLLSQIQKIKKLIPQKTNILDLISEVTNAKTKIKIPQKQHILNVNNNNVRTRRNELLHIIYKNYIRHLINNDLDFNDINLLMGFIPEQNRIIVRLTSNSFNDEIEILIDSNNDFWRLNSFLSEE
jgi:hypothetical protein